MTERYVLIFEGIGGVGKSTALKELIEETNKYLCFDRGPVSQYVYARTRDREWTLDDTNRMLDIDHLLKDVAVYVYLKASREEINDRRKEDKEYVKYGDFYDIRKAYEYYFNLTPLPVLRVDTTRLNPTQTVEKILSEVERCTDEE